LGFEELMPGLAGVDAVAEDEEGHDLNGMAFGQSEPKVVVFGVPEWGSVATEVEDGLPIEDNGGVVNAVSCEEAGADLAGVPVREAGWRDDAAGGQEVFLGGSSGNDIGMVLHPSDLEVKAAREGDIIRVHSGDVAAGGLLEAGVEGADNALGGLMDDVNGVMGLGEGIEEGGGAIVRAIVDDDEFEGGAGLAEDAADGLVQPRRGIAHGHEDGDQGPGLGGRMGWGVSQGAASWGG
jgi:hypothetical protein